MSSLAASFLEDLDELDDDSQENEEKKDDELEDNDIDDDLSEDDNESDDNTKDFVNHPGMAVDDSVLVEMASAKVSINAIGNLRITSRYKRLLDNVNSSLAKPNTNFDIEGVLEEDPEYRLLLSCNKLVQDIDDDIINSYKYVTQLYSKKFPELQNLIVNKIDYIRVLRRIGNETDLTLINLSDLLSPSLVMIVSVSASTTSGTSLSDSDINDTMKACNEILALDKDKSVILSFIESRMTRIAPNLCNVIEPRISAQLIGLAGGIIALSKIPSCNIQVMGQEKGRHLGGFSNAVAMPHTGILYYCDLIQTAEPSLRRKLLKVISGKVALLARVDSYKNHPDGSEGIQFRKMIEEKIEKFQAPAKARTKKALPIPEEKRKSRRGGRRARKMKEKYSVTQLQIQQNRVKFSTDVGEYGDSAMGLDTGMVGMKDTGRVRAAQVKKSKFLQLSKKPKKGGGTTGVSDGVGGLQSSLVFTPVQGIELVNPQAAAERVKQANAKWFSSNSGFLSAVPK